MTTAAASRTALGSFTEWLRGFARCGRKVCPSSSVFPQPIGLKGGWDVEQTVRLSKELHAVGVDVVDCSSGGNVHGAHVPVAPGYQVPFAKAVREAGVPSIAVGMITDPHQANQIVETGQADLIMLAREELRDPYWPLHAATALGVDVEWPVQYVRAKPPTK